MSKQLPELATRAIVGVALVGVALAAIIFGGFIFWLVCSILGLLMMAEWADLFKTPAGQKRLAQFALFAALSAMSPITWGPGFFTLGLVAAAGFFIVIVTQRPMLALGAVYVGLPTLSLLLIREQHGSGYDGFVLTVWVFALVWACDVGAYAAGRTIGGRKLAPQISPNKTWAGLIGGMAFASLFAAAMHSFYGLPLRLTLATPVLALMAQGGDLYESWLKRCAGVKDSGNIFPGHGGVLDRLDGLVPVAPVAAFLVILPRFYF
ncbi:phosphatidate cytidylyltransferase [Sphingomonas immobilis]|uniref:Phosphatidate cytidylyltransferase n=1 Tax=Sphingomonas immobilis TaxID=3063997 RepID=A0ABT8ZZY7_9SPHN|nr:phosphatidate cytidylyltransferase [Sphingomonas sp. CA1-15]MDO7842689.1 phosphatidate cytidylyltransferase [Sphingomonas sp. CA1-15]